MKQSWQKGFTIVSAIFILVVLAALGAFIVTVSTNQQIGSALDVQGSRAYWAARSGIEWGIYQVQATPNYAFGHGLLANPNSRSCANASGSFTFPSAPTLTGFTVTVSCIAQPDLLNGSITSNTSSALVTGTGTSFSTELSAGQWFCDAAGATIIGTVASITDDTNLVLTANASTAGVSVAYTRCGPTIYRITATACNQPNVAEPKCPNTTNPTNFYIERRLEVAI